MTIEETIQRIAETQGWNQRVAQIRLIPQRHGTGEHVRIFAEIARKLYLPHLAPDFAYIHPAPFYELEYFEEVYRSAAQATADFSRASERDLAAAIESDPRTLLVFRTIVGFTKEEFAHSTELAAKSLGLPPLSASKIDSMERHGTPTDPGRVQTAARTLSEIMSGSLFGRPPVALRSKQQKPDTAQGWTSVRRFATGGVPFPIYLHQRHFGGAFRQVLDATSTHRGNLIEDAVEQLFVKNRVPFIRTGSRNQREIADRFEVRVTPAPDFIVFDASDSLKAMFECKGTNDGGTARDKAMRFERLRDESARLGGVPLFAVLGGMGWTRVNDALGPVIRDTDGRVFTFATLESMMEVSPLPSLIGTAA